MTLVNSAFLSTNAWNLLGSVSEDVVVSTTRAVASAGCGRSPRVGRCDEHDFNSPKRCETGKQWLFVNKYTLELIRQTRSAYLGALHSRTLSLRITLHVLCLDRLLPLKYFFCCCQLPHMRKMDRKRRKRKSTYKTVHAAIPDRWKMCMERERERGGWGGLDFFASDAFSAVRANSLKQDHSDPVGAFD